MIQNDNFCFEAIFCTAIVHALKQLYHDLFAHSNDLSI